MKDLDICINLPRLVELVKVIPDLMDRHRVTDMSDIPFFKQKGALSIKELRHWVENINYSSCIIQVGLCCLVISICLRKWKACQNKKQIGLYI